MRASTGTLLLAAALALSGCAVSVEPPAAAPVVTPDRSDGPPPGATATAPSTAPTPSGAQAPGSAEPSGPSSPEAPSSAPSTPPASAPASAAPSSEPSAPPPPTTPPSASEAPQTPPSATPAPEVDDGQLRPGDSGPEVLALQERLSGLGYWLGTPDGSFGRLTTQAVLAVQKAAGLSRDGVVGPRTLAALEAGTWPSARTGGDGVEIDLDRQLLLVVRGGRVVTVLNTSTGVPGRYDTPPGEFRVQRAIDGLRVAPLGELWRPRYFNGGIAVHGSPSIPGHPASHGCARLSDPAIDMVWAEDLMPIGSAVTVY